MVAFLSCLNEVCRFVEKHLESIGSDSSSTKPNSNKIPYTIKGDCIGNASIKMQFSTDEMWTKALTLMLINCKWLLAFASNFGTS
ncbi:hypothetical protein BB560_003613 [Smittium megazygosporum]|uniref:Atg6 BARA domain-containing protein n=1 Tax=Smittium megazygosporum TaxID=133381 RepID=A0A2T9ZBF9_9FUNG|nr:hypothetical protein BB560_003613 [Smittium megazygosporum]